MGVKCSTYWWEKKRVQNCKTRIWNEESPVGRPRRRWEYYV